MSISSTYIYLKRNISNSISIDRLLDYVIHARYPKTVVEIYKMNIRTPPPQKKIILCFTDLHKNILYCFESKSFTKSQYLKVIQYSNSYKMFIDNTVIFRIRLYVEIMTPNYLHLYVLLFCKVMLEEERQL